MAPSSLIRRMTVSSSSHPDDGQGGRNAAGPQPLRLSAQAFGERGGHWRPLPKLRHQVYLPITDS